MLKYRPNTSLFLLFSYLLLGVIPSQGIIETNRNNTGMVCYYAYRTDSYEVIINNYFPHDKSMAKMVKKAKGVKNKGLITLEINEINGINEINEKAILMDGYLRKVAKEVVFDHNIRNIIYDYMKYRPVHLNLIRVDEVKAIDIDPLILSKIRAVSFSSSGFCDIVSRGSLYEFFKKEGKNKPPIVEVKGMIPLPTFKNIGNRKLILCIDLSEIKDCECCFENLKSLKKIDKEKENLTIKLLLIKKNKSIPSHLFPLRNPKPFQGKLFWM